MKQDHSINYPSNKGSFGSAYGILLYLHLRGYKIHHMGPVNQY